MSEVIEKLAEAGYLTPEQVEEIGKNVSEFLKEAKANPALMKETIEKLGGTFWRKFTGAFPSALAHVAAGGLIGAGAVAGSRVLEDVKHGLMKSRRYKMMMDENPHLKRFPSRSVQKAFETLHRFNPEYASDPNVAGTFVRNAVEQDRIDVANVNALVSGRSGLVHARQQGRLLTPSDVMKAIPTERREYQVPGAEEAKKQLEKITVG